MLEQYVSVQDMILIAIVIGVIIIVILPHFTRGESAELRRVV